MSTALEATPASTGNLGGDDRSGDNKVKLHWVDFPGRGPPVVMAHGMLGTWSNWSTVAKHVNGKYSKRMVAFDARNHGRSPHVAQMSYHDMAGDVVDLVTSKLEEKEAVLLGHSMGGRTVMLTALLHPELVKQLIVVDVSPVNENAQLQNMDEIFEALLGVRFRNYESLSAARKDVDKQLERGGLSDRMLRSWLMMNLEQKTTGAVGWKNNIENIYEAFKTNLRNFPATDGKTYDGETVFISGGSSGYVPDSHRPGIKEMFPRAKFEVVPGSGHWLHAEKPAQFQKILDKYMK